MKKFLKGFFSKFWLFKNHSSSHIYIFKIFILKLLKMIQKQYSEGKEPKDDCTTTFFLLCHCGLHLFYVIDYLFLLRNINRISICYMRPEAFVFSSNAARIGQKVGHSCPRPFDRFVQNFSYAPDSAFWKWLTMWNWQWPKRRGFKNNLKYKIFK